MVPFISFLLAFLLILFVEKSVNSKRTVTGYSRPHFMYFLTGILCVTFDIVVVLLPRSLRGGDKIAFGALMIAFATAGAFCVYTYFACSIRIDSDSIHIASLFRKKAKIAIEDIVRLKGIGFFRVLMIEDRNTGKYYFPCDSYNLNNCLDAMRREHPKVPMAKG